MCVRVREGASVGMYVLREINLKKKEEKERKKRKKERERKYKNSEGRGEIKIFFYIQVWGELLKKEIIICMTPLCSHPGENKWHNLYVLDTMCR